MRRSMPRARTGASSSRASSAACSTTASRRSTRRRSDFDAKHRRHDPGSPARRGAARRGQGRSAPRPRRREAQALAGPARDHRGRRPPTSTTTSSRRERVHAADETASRRLRAPAAARSPPTPGAMAADELAAFEARSTIPDSRWSAARGIARAGRRRSAERVRLRSVPPHGVRRSCSACSGRSSRGTSQRDVARARAEAHKAARARPTSPRSARPTTPRPRSPRPRRHTPRSTRRPRAKRRRAPGSPSVLQNEAIGTAEAAGSRRCVHRLVPDARPVGAGGLPVERRGGTRSVAPPVNSEPARHVVR